MPAISSSVSTIGFVRIELPTRVRQDRRDVRLPDAEGAQSRDLEDRRPVAERHDQRAACLGVVGRLRQSRHQPPEPRVPPERGRAGTAFHERPDVRRGDRCQCRPTGRAVGHGELGAQRRCQAVHRPQPRVRQADARQQGRIGHARPRLRRVRPVRGGVPGHEAVAGRLQPRECQGVGQRAGPLRGVRLQQLRERVHPVRRDARRGRCRRAGPGPPRHPPPPAARRGTSACSLPDRAP